MKKDFQKIFTGFQDPPIPTRCTHRKMVKIDMDSFSDDEALARKEDSDEELEDIDFKEKEKCEVIEILEKLKEEMKENREDRKHELKLAQ